MRNFAIGLVLLFSVGCCSNYKTYVLSVEKDLEVLSETYTEYVENDKRLSPADKKARLAVIEELQEKTDVAKKDIE